MTHNVTTKKKKIKMSNINIIYHVIQKLFLLRTIITVYLNLMMTKKTVTPTQL